MGTILSLATVQVSFSYAGAFHTIIGPDGRPMVVQIQEKAQKKLEVKEQPKPKQSSDSVVHQVEIQSPSQVQLKKDLKNTPPTLVEQTIAAPHVVTPTPVPLNVVKKNLLPVEDIVAKPIKPTVKNTIELEQAALGNQYKNTWVDQLQKVEATKPVPAEIIENQSLNQNPAQAAQVKTPEPLVKLKAENTNKTEQGFSTINGEKYVNNEYLEDKEFNLEGKKRFYTMPEGVIDNKVGQTRMQTIEREKGVGRSVINNLFKRDQPVDNGPITLATSYYRVSNSDAVQGLGQQCFTDKKMKKAKELDIQQDINLWPRAPISEEFDYEVVKLKSPLQNIRINSFASRVQNPTFYWPFVVFLDSKGCVIEGAGGFKNNDGQADHFYHEKIEGIIQVPKGSQYLLLTPLASAIDVDGRVLSNQGQLKLTAIR